mmetsp:Transcript_61031/g.170325  ORF Transcript_61031/g.170325 Transcript_61031/m.170325 type:complete len:211 (-) Transcript_61031:545-1177(-)
MDLTIWKVGVASPGNHDHSSAARVSRVTATRSKTNASACAMSCLFTELTTHWASIRRRPEDVFTTPSATRSWPMNRYSENHILTAVSTKFKTTHRAVMVDKSWLPGLRTSRTTETQKHTKTISTCNRKMSNMLCSSCLFSGNAPCTAMCLILIRNVRYAYTLAVSIERPCHSGLQYLSMLASSESAHHLQLRSKHQATPCSQFSRSQHRT